MQVEANQLPKNLNKMLMDRSDIITIDQTGQKSPSKYIKIVEVSNFYKTYTQPGQPNINRSKILISTDKSSKRGGGGHYGQFSFFKRKNDA